MKYLKNIFCLLIIFSPYFVIAQTTRITVLNKKDNTPINGISILSETGSLIGKTNQKGEFVFNKSDFGKLDLKKLMFYDTGYQSVEFPVSALPSIIHLEELKTNQLDGVVVTAKRTNKSYILNAYVRSWKLVNDKLVRYGDALIEYEMPFEISKNPFRAQNKKYVKQFRNFKVDSIKSKSKIISISFRDGFFEDNIPNGDRVSSSWSWYTMKKNADSLYDVYDEGKKAGYAIVKNNSPVEINVTDVFEGEDALKIALWWKVAGKSNRIEKWATTDAIRRPTYIFSDKKLLEKTNHIETVTEIFIDPEINYNLIKPEKYKSIIGIDQSFYSSDYWIEKLKKHPLPSSISEQLNSVNELKNTY